MKKLRGLSIISLLFAGVSALLPGCIKNDIPYPQLVQSIRGIEAEGESQSAYIDSIAYEVNVYLEEKSVSFIYRVYFRHSPASLATLSL